jgi:DNA polymerase-3 subunit gamma/tau
MSDSPPTTTDATPGDGRYTVIARRYRPQSFEDLVGQEHVARALQQAIASGRVGHAYLFAGARGVGKTSAARILAKALNCVNGPTPTPCNECDVCRRVTAGDDMDVLEIDGASNNGVDEVRQLRQNASVLPSRERFKIYIIDEVHMLSKSAFNALLKTLEEPPEHVKFIFATTEPQKIPITILSRCQRFDFAGISPESIQTRLNQIAKAEGVEVGPAALQILASRAAGSMRDSQSLLEQLLAVGRAKITADDVTQLLGIAPAERLNGLVRHLVNREAPAALAELDMTIQSGVEIGLLLDQLIGYFRDVMALAAGCNPEQMLYALPSQGPEVAEIGRQLGLSTVLAISQILDQTSARMRVSMHGRTLVELAVVRICQLGELDDLAALVAELRGDGAAEGTSPPGGSERPRITGVAHTAAPAPAKKNDEGQGAPTLASGVASAAAAVSNVTPVSVAPPTAPGGVGPTPAADDPARSQPSPAMANGRNRERSERVASAQDVNDLLAETADPDSTGLAPSESVLAQFQRSIAQGTPPTTAEPARKSRREQLAQVAEQPFVQRAMELFDVQTQQLRYSPPESDEKRS